MKDLFNQLQEQTILYAIVRVIAVLIITQIVKYIVDRIFDSKIKQKLTNNKYQAKTNTVISIVKNLVNIVVYFLAITFILNIFNIDTTSILAVAGVGGMAVAFASKSIVEDLITGAFILVENQFNIGDLIEVNGVTGTVIFMGIRLTKLKDINGREIIIPNSEIGTVINYSINDMRAAVSIFISSKKDLEFVLKTIRKTLENTKSIFDGYRVDPSIVGVDEFSDYNYKILVEAYVENGRQWQAQRLLRAEIIKSLQNNNIGFSSINLDEGNINV